MADISKIRIKGVEYDLKDIISRLADKSLEERVEVLERVDSILDMALEDVEV